jgi:hypothetical protein
MRLLCGSSVRELVGGAVAVRRVNAPRGGVKHCAARVQHRLAVVAPIPHAPLQRVSRLRKHWAAAGRGRGIITRLHLRCVAVLQGCSLRRTAVSLLLLQRAIEATLLHRRVTDHTGGAGPGGHQHVLGSCRHCQLPGLGGHAPECAHPVKEHQPGREGHAALDSVARDTVADRESLWPAVSVAPCAGLRDTRTLPFAWRYRTPASTAAWPPPCSVSAKPDASSCVFQK